MIEKVNPDHPDKLADRIAGALVDYAYEEQDAPRVAFEVLLGHGEVNIIGESSVYVPRRVAKQIITRILKHEDYNLNMNIAEQLKDYDIVINPLGLWSGGENVDAGATNRKLGSDMGRAVTGGGLHGKDLSKADVAVNIYAHMQAEDCNNRVELSCAIGDADINGVPYREIVRIAKEYIDKLGGFERLAEWGLS